MAVLNGRVDFTMVIGVTHANPNGDPSNGNRPREGFDGRGEITSGCLKHKIRTALQEMGEPIFIQADGNVTDGFNSLKARADGNDALKSISRGKATNKDDYGKVACDEWYDVRAFGQVFAFKNDSASVGVRGPVTIQDAISVAPITIESMQITRCTNAEDKAEMASDRMGWRHKVAHGLYVANGSISCQLAEKTGFTDEDAEKLKNAILTMFDNDVSAARPAGSMEVLKLYWWEHESKTPMYSPGQVHRQVCINVKDGVDVPNSLNDYDIVFNALDCVEPIVYSSL